MNIVGIGKVGCALADKWANQENTVVYKIDHSIVGAQKTPELYEENFPTNKIKTFLKTIQTEPTLLIVCGANIVSAITLRVVEILGPEIDVLYISPHLSQLTQQQRLNDKVVHNVLQNYARAGKFRMMYMLDNNLIEKYMGDIPIIGYFDRINDTIFQTFNLVETLIGNEPVMGVNPVPMDVCRLATLGVVSPDNEIALFNDLSNPRQIHYVFAINEEKLRTDGALLRHIRAQVASNKIATTYGVYATNYENDYTYCVAFTSVLNEKK